MKYYVLVIETNKLYGPMAFKEAMAMKTAYDTFAEFNIILKIVVDELGNEVV